MKSLLMMNSKRKPYTNVVWTNRTITTSGWWQDVTYGAGLFVAVGRGSSIATSPDGITWTNRTGITNHIYFCIVWNGIIFVATGATSNGTCVIITSPDGITWTDRSPYQGGSLSQIIWDGSRFIGYDTTGRKITSTDGITWSMSTTAVIPSSISGIAYNGSTYVAVGYDSGENDNWLLAYTSTNGDTGWVSRIPAYQYLISNPYKTYWNGTNFVVLSEPDTSGGTIFTSPDGITWMRRAIFFSVSWYDGIHVNGLDIAVGNNAFATSTDGGVTWIRTNMASTPLYGIGFNPNTDLVVAVGGTNKCMTGVLS
jgi:hypothetical protein